MMFLPANYGGKDLPAQQSISFMLCFKAHMRNSGCRLYLFEMVVWQQRSRAPTGYR
jgi:hypothetical protein